MSTPKTRNHLTLEVFITNSDDPAVVVGFPHAVTHIALSPDAADRLAISLHMKADELRAVKLAKAGKIN